MRNFMPILDWLPSYDEVQFRGDLSAGLTVGVMIIPQSMAYAMLAGMPPVYGLYASTLPLFIYAILGTSRHLAIGPVALVALLVSSGVGDIATLGSPEFISLVILLTLMVGIVQLLMGIFRLGFMVNFLSQPVLAGFTSAAAIIIGFSQLKHLIGVDIPRGRLHETLQYLFANYTEINLPTMTIGLAALMFMLLIRRVNVRIPGPLIVVLIGIVLVFSFSLENRGVAIVGEAATGTPSFGWPDWSYEKVQSLVPGALSIAFIGFIQSIAIAKAIQARHKNYDLDSNQELIALGAANIGGSLFNAFPTAGGFSRSAVNDQSGGKTAMSSVISGSIVLIVLFFLTDYLFYLPISVLAAIIITAVLRLIDVEEAINLWETDRTDFAMFLITGLGTLFLGVEEGILLGVSLSVLMVVYNVSYPNAAELGKVPDLPEYRNIKRFADLEEYDDILIIRFDARLYFANISYFRKFLSQAARKKEDLKHLILDCKSINSLDSSAVHMLRDLIQDCHQEGIILYFVNLKGPVRDIMEKSHLLEEIGEERIFMTIQDAIDAIEGEHDDDKKEYALQTNN